MKINRVAWEKTRKRSLLYAWPSLISAVVLLFIFPMTVNASPTLALLMPFLSLLIFAPFVVVDVRRHREEAAQEKRELQAKYDAEDKAMFGKPLREIEI